MLGALKIAPVRTTAHVRARLSADGRSLKYDP